MIDSMQARVAPFLSAPSLCLLWRCQDVYPTVQHIQLAQAQLLAADEQAPLAALGLQVVPCPSCGEWHPGLSDVELSSPLTLHHHLRGDVTLPSDLTPRPVAQVPAEGSSLVRAVLQGQPSAGQGGLRPQETRISLQ